MNGPDGPASIRELADAVRPSDPAKAAELYAQAAGEGDGAAASSLGYMYLVGDGVQEDRGMAMRYLEMAAELGDPRGMSNLATVILQDDPGRALGLFTAAGEAGHVSAMMYAATMLRGGHGIPADPQAAAMWLERASSEDAEAAHILAHMLRTGEGVPEDKPKAAVLYKQAAEAGIADAQYDLAMMLDSGDGVPTDREGAERWFREAAAQGDGDARLCLGGILYERGEFEAARSLFTDCAMDGDVRAMFNLALMLTEGSLPRDDTEAREWLETAGEAGFVPAQSMLGAMLMQSDPVGAERWLREAASNGEPSAKYNLGALLLSVGGDDREAVGWLTEAANENVGEAAELLRRLSSMRSEELLQRRDLVRARQAGLGDAAGPDDYGAVHAERQGRAGVVGAVAHEQHVLPRDVEPGERQGQGLWVRLVMLGVVPSDDRLRDVREPRLLQQVLDLVAHLARDDAYALAPGAQLPQRRDRVGEGLCALVRVGVHDLEEPAAELAVGAGDARVPVVDLVHGHAEIPLEVLPAVLHAYRRQRDLEYRVYPRARLEERVVEVEQIELVSPHLVAT